MRIFTIAPSFYPLARASVQWREDHEEPEVLEFIALFSETEVRQLETRGPDVLKPYVVDRLNELNFEDTDRIYPFGPPTLVVALVVAANTFYETEFRLTGTENPFSQIIAGKAGPSPG
jgi:hypothetical protein